MLSFRDLMAATGYFLFRWSRLELSLSESILKGEASIGRTADNGAPSFPSVTGSFPDRLKRWRAVMQAKADPDLIEAIAQQAEKVRVFRNTLVHGLAGGNSAPRNGEEPHLRCIVGGWERPNGEIRKIGVSELERYIEAADACARAFDHPHAFNFRL